MTLKERGFFFSPTGIWTTVPWNQKPVCWPLVFHILLMSHQHWWMNVLSFVRLVVSIDLFLSHFCSFSYRGVYWVDLVLSIYDIIYFVKIDMFFNVKYKRRTPPINMSVRDEGLSVIAVWALKRTKSRRGWGRHRLDHCVILHCTKRYKENWEEVNGDY